MTVYVRQLSRNDYSEPKLCRAVRIVGSILCTKRLVQFAHRLVLRHNGNCFDVKAETDLDVLLREVVLMDQDLADLIGGIGIRALIGVVILDQELAVTALDDRLGVQLDLVHDPQDLGDLGVERRLGAEEDVAVWVGGVVAIVDQLGVGADLAVVAGDELEEAQNAALIHGAEDKGRGRFEEALLDVLGESYQAHHEVLRLRLLDLPDVEIDEAHGEHVVGEERELVLAVGVVGLEGVPEKRDVVLLLRALEGERQVLVHHPKSIPAN